MADGALDWIPSGGLYLVRHAFPTQDPGNPGLSDYGHLQAEAVGALLAAMISNPHILCSPLRRAYETAEHIVSAFGGNDADLSADERLAPNTGSQCIEAYRATDQPVVVAVTHEDIIAITVARACGRNISPRRASTTVLRKRPDGVDVEVIPPPD